MRGETDNRGTKERIFFAAAKLFADKGYMGASMREVAEAAGIRASSIYNHYDSKEEIIGDLVGYYLDRMEIFYERMRNEKVEIVRKEDLGAALNKMILSYDAGELELMYYLTRIVHREQFTIPEAEQALVGEGYKKYLAAHVAYFDKLSDAGFIKGKERNKYYAEIYARLSLTFATQFLHPEVEHTIKNQDELAEFMHEMVTAYERGLEG